MFKTGKTQISFDKAGLIAEKLGLDKQDFWFKYFKEYQSNVFAKYERVLAQPTLSKNEMILINYLGEKNRYSQFDHLIRLIKKRLLFRRHFFNTCSNIPFQKILRKAL